MKKFFVPLAAFAIILSAVIFITANSKNDDPKSGDVKKVENFSLNDYNGKSHSLEDYKDSKAIVLMFIATKCPVSNDYNSRMEEIYNKYSKQGITFIGINSNKAENADEVKEHAATNNLTFTILKDPNNIIADKLNAKVTPEIFVLNSNFEVLYHGRIDDSQRIDKVTTNDLSLALDAILEGKEIANPRTKAFGCTIKRVN